VNDHDLIPPATPAELSAWLREHLDVHAADAPLLPGHDSPLAYLSHAFFEDERPARPATEPREALDADKQSGQPLDCVVWANRGGGKTFLAAVATALDLLFRPGIQVRILAGSLEQAQRMHAHLARLLERPPFRDLIDGRITARRARLINGSCAEVLASSQASVRGTRVHKIRCDEVELFDPQVWDAAQLATRSGLCGSIHVQGRIVALSTLHVPYGLMSRLIDESFARTRRLFKWGAVDTLERCGPRFTCRVDPARLHADPDARDCPLWNECRGRAKERPGPGHLPIRDAITMKARVSLAQWESEMLCLRPRRTDSVYDEFDLARHVIDELPPFDPAPETLDRHGDPILRPPAILASIDFGFRNPTVILWARLCPRADGAHTLIIVSERIEASTVLAAHIEALQQGPAPFWIAIDPAGTHVNDQTGVSNASLLREAGFRVKHRNASIAAGVRLVRARLQPADGTSPRLLIHRACTGLIRALQQYHYDPKNLESTTPVKDDSDHAADALRYMVLCLDQPYKTTVNG